MISDNTLRIGFQQQQQQQQQFDAVNYCSTAGGSGLAVACLTAVREVLGSNRAVGCSCVYRTTTAIYRLGHGLCAVSRRLCEVALAEIRTCNLPIASPALYHTATSASGSTQPFSAVMGSATSSRRSGLAQSPRRLSFFFAFSLLHMTSSGQETEGCHR